MNTESKEKNKQFSMRRFFKSFKYTWEGLVYAYHNEQSMTLIFFVSILVTALGILLKINPFEWAFCILGLGIMVAIELLNTAIEAVVDLASPEIHPLAKIAKDTGSAASGVYSFLVFISACFIFIPKIISLF